ncbi:hypothetical protein Trco_001719 [Trichoderma cornu-damae]|uniref:Uncharacterized protein n=1 Tax=Trichoderma cornu-damae TaxID=654480 RepID=A0A9P8QSE3_9HYPO|nr:hypothetical protein Trco_001719 [Trichoderma cornu-damae]
MPNRGTLGPLLVVDHHPDGSRLAPALDELIGPLLEDGGVQPQVVLGHPDRPQGPAGILPLRLGEARLDPCLDDVLAPLRGLALKGLLQQEAPRRDGLGDLVLAGVHALHLGGRRHPDEVAVRRLRKADVGEVVPPGEDELVVAGAAGGVRHGYEQLRRRGLVDLAQQIAPRHVVVARLPQHDDDVGEQEEDAGVVGVDGGLVGRRELQEVGGEDEAALGLQVGGPRLDHVPQPVGDVGLVRQGIVHGADVGDDVSRLEHGLQRRVGDGQRGDDLVDEQAVPRQPLHGLDEERADGLLAGLADALPEARLLVEEGVEQRREVLARLDVVLVALGEPGEPLEEEPGHGEGAEGVLGPGGVAVAARRPGGGREVHGRRLHVLDGVLLRLVHDPAQLFDEGRVDLQDAVRRLGEQLLELLLGRAEALDGPLLGVVPKVVGHRLDQLPHLEHVALLRVDELAHLHAQLNLLVLGEGLVAVERRGLRGRAAQLAGGQEDGLAKQLDQRRVRPVLAQRRVDDVVLVVGHLFELGGLGRHDGAGRQEEVNVDVADVLRLQGLVERRHDVGGVVALDHLLDEVGGVLLAEQGRRAAGPPPPGRVGGLEMGLDIVGELPEVPEEAKGQAAVDLVALELARQVVDDAVEGRAGRDGDAREGPEAGGREDVDLDAGAVEGVVGRGRGPMEDEHGQLAQQRVCGVVESDVLGRERQLVRDTHHGESRLVSGRRS